MYRKIKNYKLLLVILAMVGIYSLTIITASINIIYRNSSERALIILPLIYCLGLTMLLMISNNFFSNLVQMIVIGLYGIRMLLYPLCASIVGVHILKVSSNVYESLGASVLIQCYEFIVVIIILIAYKARKNSEGQFNYIRDFKSTKYIRAIILMLISISTVIIIVYPQMLSRFRPILFLSEEAEIAWRISSNVAASTIPTMVYYLGGWTLIILKVLISYLGVIYVKRWAERGNREVVGIMISILIISTILLITTDDRAGSFLGAFAMLLLLIKLYPNKKKILVSSTVAIVGFTGILVLIILPLLSGNGGETENYLIQYISNKVNAYFSGTINIAAALQMPKDNRIQLMLGDILRSIPLVMGFFTHMDTSNMLFNTTLGMDLIYSSQILPNIGQSAFYFGVILSPLFSGILIIGAQYSYNRALLAKDSLGYFIYTYMMLFLICGPVLYYFTLTSFLIMQYIVPMLVMYKIFKNKK